MKKTEKMHGRRRRQLRKRQLAGIGVLCLLAVLFCNRAAMASQNTMSRITIKADNLQIKQEEAVPEAKIEVSCFGDKKAVLDAETNYTVEDFIRDLNGGTGYTVKEDVDNLTEGTYPIDLVLSDDINEKLSGEWFGKIDLELDDGEIVVENKFGTWDGSDKFKDWNGNQIASAWIVSKGNTYYFGADGIKMTGMQNIDGKNYFFGDDGVRKTGWQDYDGGKCYLSDEDGTMCIGWNDIGGKTYYFGTDGKMMTGEQQIGVFKCSFADDGSLISKDETVDPSKPMIAVTFDDGPGEDTARLLDALQEYGAHATFFMVGGSVSNYPESVQRMQDAGCELGNHSWNHPKLTSLGAGEIQQQIGDTNNAISAIVGHGATVLRPPYGATDDAVSSVVGMPQILWSVDTLDWKTKSKDATVQSIMTAQDGDIVLLHDIHSWSVDAFIEALPQLTGKGYQLLTVSELASAKGIALENGGKYTDFCQK